MPSLFRRADRPAARTIRLLQAADFHGSNAAFRKFLGAVRQHGAEHAIVTGDLTGKAIVPIIRAPDNDDELIKLSNSTAFGLSSGVCTNDFRRMQKYIAGLHVGTVNIWEVPGYRIEMSPFGGIKDSGNGYKEGVIEAMKSFTNVKTFSLPW